MRLHVTSLSSDPVGMRRVGIDDSRLFLLDGNPFALFAGVAPVGQDMADAQCGHHHTSTAAFVSLCVSLSLFAFSLSLILCSPPCCFEVAMKCTLPGLPVPTSSVSLLFGASRG